MWIDALCIDRGSIGERGSQVAQMHSIVTLATMVIVFFGEAWQDRLLLWITSLLLGRIPNLYLDPSLEPHAECHHLDVKSPSL
jgi:hypothetical protein